MMGDNGSEGAPAKYYCHRPSRNTSLIREGTRQHLLQEVWVR